jgi:serine/threonine protein kinase
MSQPENPIEPGQQLNGRYEVVRELGSGSFGEAFEAVDTEDGRHVAIKRLTLTSVGDWRAVELFEREARVLRSLEHTAIPRYIDFFCLEAKGQLHLVQELVEGETLAARIAAGARFSEEEVTDIASQILHVLSYLQELRPPVFHRDLKPDNLVRRDDGKIYLVDFGSVGGALRSAGSIAGTVAGTFGYMAPEQLHGHAEPATDLYGLGATLLHLVTHQHPGEFSQKRLKIDLDDVFTGSPQFRTWLQKLLEPAPEDRFPTARAALIALREPPSEAPTETKDLHESQEPKARKLAKYPRIPHGSRILMKRTESTLTLTIRGHASMASFSRLPFALLTAFFLVIPSNRWKGGSPPPPFFLMPFVLISAYQLFQFIWETFGKTFFAIDSTGFELKKSLFGFGSTTHGKTARLEHVEVKTGVAINSKSAPPRFVALHEGSVEHRLGRHLSDSEREWVADVIDVFMKRRRRKLAP